MHDRISDSRPATSIRKNARAHKDRADSSTRKDNVEKLQRRLEAEHRLREADKYATIAMLAGNLAHCIGTPLNVMRGRAEHLLEREQNPPKTAQGLETIIKQIDKITQTIKFLIEFASRVDTRREPRDLREVVSSSMDLVPRVANGTPLTLSLDVGDDPLMVRCNADQLQQLFINVIENTLEAAGERAQPVKIVARRVRDYEPQIRVTFEFSGPNVMAGAGSRFFDALFTQTELHGPIMRHAVAEWIARDHNGEMAYEADESRARLVLSLPATESEAQRVVP